MTNSARSRDTGHAPHISGIDLTMVLWQHVPVQAIRCASAAKWRQLFDRLTNNDPIIERKLITAMSAEPLLAAGAPVSVAARDYIRRAFEARGKLPQDHCDSTLPTTTNK
jgi:hypothetical protein